MNHALHRGSSVFPVLAGLVLTAVVAVVAWFVLQGQSLPDEPVPVVWDRTPCAACAMHVGEKGFAAEIVTADGEVRFYDDPGCALNDYLALQEQGVPIHRVWFHHRTEDRWLSRSEVGFVEADPTPMGYGLAAVDRDAPKAMDFERALEEVRE